MAQRCSRNCLEDLPFNHIHKQVQVLNKMGEKVLRDLFDKFGVSRYHGRGIFGQGVSITIIDTGLKRDSAQNVVSFGADINVHGLAVSSLIAPPDNEFGLVGIAPQAHVELADVRDPSSIPIDAVLQAIRRAIDNNSDIISISLGTDDSYSPLQTLIDEASAKGILVFAAAGNSGDRGYEYPAACFRAISVASLNNARQPSPFNTRNDAVVLFAPGERLMLPTAENGALEEYSGTSFATPFAAGLAALVLSAKRSEEGKKVRLNRREMIDILRNPHHLHLNCEEHTYVMDRTCTNYEGLIDHERDKQKKSFSAKLGIGLALLFVVLASMIAFMMRKN